MTYNIKTVYQDREEFYSWCCSQGVEPEYQGSIIPSTDFWYIKDKKILSMALLRWPLLETEYIHD